MKGRPPRAGVASTRNITLRVTEEEHALLSAAARYSQKKVASWVRDRAVAVARGKAALTAPPAGGE